MVNSYSTTQPPSPIIMSILLFMIVVVSIYTSSSPSSSIERINYFSLVPAAYASSSSSSSSSSIPPSSLSFARQRKSRVFIKNKHPFYIPRGGDDNNNNNGNKNSVVKANDILVIGSLNADTFLPVSRLPTKGENLCIPPNTEPAIDVPGGKGCTQAIACSSLLSSSSSSPSKVCFLGQFGNDHAASILENTLQTSNVELSDYCTKCVHVPSGRGYVFRSIADGSVSAVISGGSNALGWGGWRSLIENTSSSPDDTPEEKEEGKTMTKSNLSNLFQNKACVLLQREIPEFVNKIIVNQAKKEHVIVIQDVGGEDRPITSETMQYCDYLIPNQSELIRLVHSFQDTTEKDGDVFDAESKDEKDEVIRYAKFLQKHGANNVLVTLGAKGSVLITTNATKTIYVKACSLPPNTKVVDETGAGDCYRAAFAVALSEGKTSLEECMKFASAAGALAVTKEGAVPSVPSRKEVDELYSAEFGGGNIGGNDSDENDEVVGGISEESIATSLPRGGDGNIHNYGHDENDDNDDECPLLFGSRLNSMKDRPDLCPPNSSLNDVRDWVKRQGTISGLNCVDFNYPQHFHTWTNQEAKTALENENLVAGAVCLRYPSKFARGAMIHPDPALRREAIELTLEAARTAKELGCNEVVVWSAYDGYDYPFQVDYDEKWMQVVEAFRECCDAYPDVKFSLEFKPTDENTRFFTVPSTGAALLLVKEIDRPNMGLTLDVGHMLMAGENPGQSIAMVGREKKLFGVQLNDGYTRLAAEDGMMFGSIHPSMALEVIYQLRRTGYKGHFYFDTFPQRTDPVREAEYNIRRVKEFWKAAGKLDDMGLQKVMEDHDALGALDITNKAI